MAGYRGQPPAPTKAGSKDGEEGYRDSEDEDRDEDEKMKSMKPMMKPRVAETGSDLDRLPPAKDKGSAPQRESESTEDVDYLLLTPTA
ncbi:hypothetical protein VNI00_018599 [Paramarasmius palmivorus]|uniref:Uncharacterized protein n=1 Tax=Paramarasmius palmivorus TaxID=297713 RepID=A0AAW0AXS3_9AGAR